MTIFETKGSKGFVFETTYLAQCSWQTLVLNHFFHSLPESQRPTDGPEHEVTLHDCHMC